MRRDRPETQEYMWHSNVSELDKEFSSRRGLKSPAAREVDGQNGFPKGTFHLQGPKLNVLIRDKIYFVGIALKAIIIIWGTWRAAEDFVRGRCIALSHA